MWLTREQKSAINKEQWRRYTPARMEKLRQEKYSPRRSKMDQPLVVINNLDQDGKPAGGTVTAEGITIRWQNGPLGRGRSRIEPNGAFAEGVIEAARQRIQWYQDNGFACRENALAITKLEEANHWLNARTARRESQGVEGTHEGN